jgi:hypothetical protein
MKYSQVENRIPRFVDPHKKQASAGVLEKKKMPDSREKRSNQRKHQPYTRQYTLTLQLQPRNLRLVAAMSNPTFLAGSSPWWQFGRSTASSKSGKNCENGIAKSKSSYWYNRYCPTESKISKEKEANPEPISYRIMC